MGTIVKTGGTFIPLQSNTSPRARPKSTCKAEGAPQAKLASGLAACEIAPQGPGEAGCRLPQRRHQAAAAVQRRPQGRRPLQPVTLVHSGWRSLHRRTGRPFLSPPGPRVKTKSRGAGMGGRSRPSSPMKWPGWPPPETLLLTLGKSVSVLRLFNVIQQIREGLQHTRLLAMRQRMKQGRSLSSERLSRGAMSSEHRSVENQSGAHPLRGANA